jgi:hypothetical protein
MNAMPITLSQLVTATQTATSADIPHVKYLRSHMGMFQVLQGKIGLKGARQWLLGAALLDLHSQSASGIEKPDA